MSISLRELRAVRLVLSRSFADYVSAPHIRRLLLHEDNAAVVAILNSMVSASRPMMSEIRKLRVLLRVLGVDIEARWIPSAVNRFADSLPRTWAPGDVQASRQLVTSIRHRYQLSLDVFARFPMGETVPKRARQIRTELEKSWDDGCTRLWNTHADFLPLVIRKLEQERPHGLLLCPFWPAQSWFARLRRLASSMEILRPNPAHIPAARPNPHWRVVLATIGSVRNGVLGFDSLS